MNMKRNLRIVLAFAIFAFGLCEMNSKEMDEIAEKCMKKIEASEADMKVLETFDTMPTSRLQFCLVACFYKGTGMMDASNKFILDKSLEEIEPLKDSDLNVYNTMVGVIKECVKTVVPVADECDAAKTFLQCVDKGWQ